MKSLSILRRSAAALATFAFFNAPVLAAGPTAPGGLYVGYYQENPLANPEDPMPGAFVLQLPDADATFNGSMFFTFVGCQKSNVGAVKGAKTGYQLKGEWSGNIDNSQQSGPYSGTYDPVKGAYKGTYSNSAGKQFKDIKGCIQYWIGPHGSWEMFAVEKSQPESFKPAVAGALVTWPKVPGAAMTLVYVIDQALAQTGSGNPVKFQTVLMGANARFDLASAGLSKGREYIAVALVNNDRAQRVAFGSKRFVAP